MSERGTGRTTRMLEEAYLCHAEYVVILGPTSQVLRHLMALTLEILPFKPDRMGRSRFRIADQWFHYMIPTHETANMLRGIKSIESFADHTLFEMPFVTADLMESYHEIISLVQQRKVVNNE